jgi:hypothetical protein
MVFRIVVVCLMRFVARPFVTGSRSSSGAGRSGGVSTTAACGSDRTTGRSSATTAASGGSRDLLQIQIE